MGRGQGLPLNTIVLAALAVLVLLLVVGFTTGSLSKLFKGLGSQTSGIDLETARTTCNRYCTELKNMEAAGTLTTDIVRNSRYVTSVFPIDLNNDGKLSQEEKNLHCWQKPINVPCSVTIRSATGQVIVCQPYNDRVLECRQG